MVHGGPALSTSPCVVFLFPLLLLMFSSSPVSFLFFFLFHLSIFLSLPTLFLIFSVLFPVTYSHLFFRTLFLFLFLSSCHLLSLPTSPRHTPFSTSPPIHFPPSCSPSRTKWRPYVAPQSASSLKWVSDRALHVLTRPLPPVSALIVSGVAAGHSALETIPSPYHMFLALLRINFTVSPTLFPMIGFEHVLPTARCVHMGDHHVCPSLTTRNSIPVSSTPEISSGPEGYWKIGASSFPYSSQPATLGLNVSFAFSIFHLCLLHPLVGLPVYSPGSFYMIPSGSAAFG